MKSLLSVILFISIGLSPLAAYAGGSAASSARRERTCIKNGNEAYRAGDYAKAEEWYKEALQYNATSELALFNLALVIERLKPSSAAPESGSPSTPSNAVDSLYSNPTALLTKVTELSSDPALRKAAYYNLGNIAFNRQDYAGAIELYKQSLRIDETNMKARQNLRIAQLKLQQQQQNQQNQQDQEEQQEEENQQQQEQDQQQQQQDQQDQQNQQNQQNSNQQQSPQSNGKQTDRNAEQILEAARKQEAMTRDKVEQRQNAPNTRITTDHPW